MYAVHLNSWPVHPSTHAPLPGSERKKKKKTQQLTRSLAHKHPTLLEYTGSTPYMTKENIHFISSILPATNLTYSSSKATTTAVKLFSSLSCDETKHIRRAVERQPPPPPQHLDLIPQSPLVEEKVQNSPNTNLLGVIIKNTWILALRQCAVNTNLVWVIIS